jgi:hypothetical protein
MDRKELTSEDIEKGKKLLLGLDRDNFPVSAALWLLDTEVSVWRYLIASSELDELGPIGAYNKLQAEMTRVLGHDSIVFSKVVTILSPANPLIKLLQKAISTGGPESVSGIRFTGNVIDNQYIDDAYLYRV